MVPPLGPSPARALVLLLLVLAGAVALGLSVGSTGVGPADVVLTLIGRADPVVAAIVLDARLPTVLLALLVGAALAVSGAMTQGALSNPLADPFLLGVSGGAALGAAIAVAGRAHAAAVPLPIAAWAGATAAVLITAALVRRLSSPGVPLDRRTMLLVGVVLNALASALMLVVFALLSPVQGRELVLWLMGSLAPSRGTALEQGMAAAIVGVGAVWGSARAARLNVLSLGDLQAGALGLDVGRERRFVLLASAAITAAAVAFSGLVGFVGLIVPHAVRLWLGPDFRRVVPASAIAGAAFLIVADALARALFPLLGTQIPVGAVTALCGAPLFFALLIRNARAGEP